MLVLLCCLDTYSLAKLTNENLRRPNKAHHRGYSTEY